MRKLYWYFSSYIRKHGLIVLLTIIFAVVLFSFFAPVLARVFENKQARYVGVVGDYQLDALPLEITSLLSSGLTQVEDDGTVVPELAERWAVEDEGKSFRFILKKNLQWQDGKSLVPSDINYQFSDVETLTTPNEIVFKLPEIFVPFPTVVSQPLLRVGQKRHLLFFTRPTLIGIGAFRLTDFQQKGNRLTSLSLENARERRLFRFYLTEEEAILAYKRGEVDIVSNLSAPPDVSAWPNTHMQTTLDTRKYLAVFFNLDNPLFPKSVRQALSYALSKPTGDDRAIGPIDPKSWAFLPSAKAYEYDLPRAVERLLSELDQMPNEPLNLELTTIPTFEADANMIKKEWEILGQQAHQTCLTQKEITDKNQCEKVKIAVTVRVSSFPDTQNFQLMLIGHESPTDPDQYYLWHTDQSTNFTHYRNTRIDSLLEKGRQTLDRTERLAVYQEFQQFFLEDAPAIFLRHLNTYEIRRK